MNQKERLINALGGQPTDRPPFICPGGMMNMVTTEILERLGMNWPLAYGDPHLLAGLAQGVARLTGIENLGVPFCMTVEAEALGSTVDFGSLYSEPSIIRPLLSELREWRSLTEFNLQQGRMSTVIQAVKELAAAHPSLPIIASITGPISLATTLMEAMDFFRAMYRQADEVHAFLNFLTRNLIAYAQALHEAGADVMVVADPSTSGEILGPRNFADFALPYLNLLLDAGGYDYDGQMLHICGKLNSLFPLLRDLHVTALSIDSATSAKSIGQAVEGKVMVGNVSTHLLQEGTSSQVEKAARLCLRHGIKVLAPACGLGMSTPLANLRVMAKLVRELELHGEERP